jgi:hypothetical protein
MKVYLSKIWDQVYVLPFVKVTYTRELSGDYELIIGWLNWELIIGF